METITGTDNNLEKQGLENSYTFSLNNTKENEMYAEYVLEFFEEIRYTENFRHVKYSNKTCYMRIEHYAEYRASKRDAEDMDVAVDTVLNIFDIMIDTDPTAYRTDSMKRIGTIAVYQEQQKQ